MVTATRKVRTIEALPAREITILSVTPRPFLCSSKLVPLQADVRNFNQRQSCQASTVTPVEGNGNGNVCQRIRTDCLLPEQCTRASACFCTESLCLACHQGDCSTGHLLHSQGWLHCSVALQAVSSLCVSKELVVLTLVLMCLHEPGS